MMQAFIRPAMIQAIIHPAMMQAIIHPAMMQGLVRPARFELTTFGSGGQRSIQLSYGRIELGILHALSPRQSGFR
jgi:hypothetical protein